MKTYALDTNCFINAVNPLSRDYDAMRSIILAAQSGHIRVAVSLHTLSELSSREDDALALAETLPRLPHFPIGTLGDQVATIGDLHGNFADAIKNDDLQLRLKSLANAGTDIRDRGAFIDALANNLDGFVTADRQLVANGPQTRINSEFETKVLTPLFLAEQLRASGCI